MPNAAKARGTNYIPCKTHYTHNFLGFLSEPLGHWDAAVCRREVEYLAGLGVKHVRLFQSPYGYLINAAEHVQNLGTCASILKEFGIGILLTLFEGVHTVALPRTITDGYKKSPWYDLYGADATSSWDPTSSTNPTLLNGTSGILDEFVTKDAEQTAFLTPYRGQPLGGGWIAFPGPLYMCLFDISVYPNSVVGHEALWDRMKDFITDTITVCETEGILDAVDCFNESEVSRGHATDPALANGYAILFSGTQPGLQAEYKSLLNLDPGDVPGINSLLTGITRWAAFVRWVIEAVGVLKPGVLRTVGHVSQDDIILLYGDSPFLETPPPDFISVHSYGFGHYHAGLSDLRADLAVHSGLNGLDIVLNEFHRKEQGDYHALSSFHYLSQAGLGGYVWEILETATFSQNVGDQWTSLGVIPPEGQPTPEAGLSFPTTGFARSVELDGTHQIIESRLTILQGVREWLLGEDVEAVYPLPPRYRPTLKPGKYALLEDQDGRPWQNPGGWRVVWRWAVVDTSSLLANPRSLYDSPGGNLWLTNTTRFPTVLGLGPFLNVFDQETTTLGPFLDLRQFSWQTLLPADGSKTLIIHAAIGNRDFLFDPDFDQLDWLDTVPGYVYRQDFERTTAFVSQRTRVRNELVERLTATPAHVLVVNPLTDLAEDSDLVSPTSVIVNDVFSTFSDASRNRRSRKAERASWEWLALLRFPREVNLEHLEDSLGRILLPKDTNTGLPQIELFLRRADYTHPSQGSPESGTVATLRFEARLSPV